MTSTTMLGSDSGIELLPMEGEFSNVARGDVQARPPFGLDDSEIAVDDPHDIGDFRLLGDTSGGDDEEDLLDPFSDIEIDPENGTTKFEGGISFRRKP